MFVCFVDPEKRTAQKSTKHKFYEYVFLFDKSVKETTPHTNVQTLRPKKRSEMRMSLAKRSRPKNDQK